MDDPRLSSDAGVAGNKSGGFGAKTQQAISASELDSSRQPPLPGNRNPMKETGLQTAQEFSDAKKGTPEKGVGNMDLILDIPIELSVELGRTKILVSDLLKLGQGSVVELSKIAGEPLDILANQRLIARGEVVVVNEKYGIRITEIVSPMERVERLR
jgi:flagellar motor switch protein FliN/FliY